MTCLHQDQWLCLGFFFQGLVWNDLEAGDLERAADDLLHWFGLSSTNKYEDNHRNVQDSREITDTTMMVFAAGGGAHPRMSEIKAACLKVAEGAFPDLISDQQDFVAKLLRQ